MRARAKAESERLPANSDYILKQSGRGISIVYPNRNPQAFPTCDFLAATEIHKFARKQITERRGRSGRRGRRKKKRWLPPRREKEIPFPLGKATPPQPPPPPRHTLDSPIFPNNLRPRALLGAGKSRALPKRPSTPIFACNCVYFRMRAGTPISYFNSVTVCTDLVWVKRVHTWSSEWNGETGGLVSAALMLVAQP